MLKNACRIVLLVWAGLTVLGGISSGCWFPVAIGLIVICAIA